MALLVILIKYKKKVYNNLPSISLGTGRGFSPIPSSGGNIIVDDDQISNYLLPDLFRGGSGPHDKICFIDKIQFTSSSYVITLPVCSHIFHPKCIKNHIDAGNKLCPICSKALGNYTVVV